MIEDLGSEIHLHGASPAPAWRLPPVRRELSCPRPLRHRQPDEAVHAFLTEDGSRVEPLPNPAIDTEPTGAETCREKSLLSI